MTAEISVVVPVFRSAAILPELHRRVSAVLNGITADWELILVDDASGDGTYDVMTSLHDLDHRVKTIRFARNMGQHHATLCGIQRATGRYVVTIDDDLQNPPEEIPHLIAKVDEGYDLVIGSIKAAKKHSASRNLASRTVQVMVGRILGKPKDLELTSFRCMTRRAADGIASFSGAHVYLPALMFASVPDEQITNLPVEHHERMVGRSQYTVRKLLKLTSYLLINHSYIPLRFVTGWGFVLSTVVFAYALVIGVRALLYGSPVTGFPTLAILVSFLSGNILICVGILGEYIGRLVEENARGRRQFPIFSEET